MDSFLQPNSFLKFLSTIILHFFFININSACNESHFSICMIFSNQLAHFYLIFFLFPITSSIFYCVCSIIYFLSLFSEWSSFLWQHFFPIVSFLSSTMWYFPLFCFPTISLQSSRPFLLRFYFLEHCIDYIFLNFIFKLYNIVLVLPNNKMNPPQVYPRSPSWTLLPLLPSLWVVPVHQPQASSASNLDWRLISYMILYMFQCHSPKSPHPLPLSKSP